MAPSLPSVLGLIVVRDAGMAVSVVGHSREFFSRYAGHLDAGIKRPPYHFGLQSGRNDNAAILTVVDRVWIEAGGDDHVAASLHCAGDHLLYLMQHHRAPLVLCRFLVSDRHFNSSVVPVRTPARATRTRTSLRSVGRRCLDVDD